MNYHDLCAKHETSKTMAVLTAIKSIFGDGDHEVKTGDVFDIERTQKLLNLELSHQVRLDPEMVTDFCEYSADQLAFPLMRSASHTDEDPKFEKDPHWVDPAPDDD